MLEILENVVNKAKNSEEARRLLDAHFGEKARVAELFRDPRSQPERDSNPTKRQIKLADEGILKQIKRALDDVGEKGFQMKQTWKQTVRRPVRRAESGRIAA